VGYCPRRAPQAERFLSLHRRPPGLLTRGDAAASLRLGRRRLALVRLQPSETWARGRAQALIQTPTSRRRRASCWLAGRDGPADGAAGRCAEGCLPGAPGLAPGPYRLISPSVPCGSETSARLSPLPLPAAGSDWLRERIAVGGGASPPAPLRRPTVVLLQPSNLSQRARTPLQGSRGCSPGVSQDEVGQRPE